MPPSPQTGPPDVDASPYDLTYPDVAEARAAIHALYGPEAPQMWKALLSRAGLGGHETDTGSFERLVAAMLDADPVTALCGRSLALRAGAHRRLAAVNALIRTADRQPADTRSH